MRPGVRAYHFRIAVHTGCNFTGRTFMGFYQTQTGQVWQSQRAFTTVVRFAFRTGFSDVTHGIGTHVTKTFCISVAPMPNESSTIINARFIIVLRT